MEMETTSSHPTAATTATSPPGAAAVPTPKKKTKKTSYRAMMNAMTQPSCDRDIEKEKESLRKVTGGGAFSKIDKI
jgi:hypothetical protein